MGIDNPKPDDLGQQIAYYRTIRRLYRLRKEEAARSLLQITYMYAMEKHDELLYGENLTEAEIMTSVEEIKEGVQYNDVSEVVTLASDGCDSEQLLI